MKFIRTRNFNRAEGKFSIWTVILDVKEIKKFHEKYPGKKIYSPCTHFKVVTSSPKKDWVSITLLDNIEDLNSVVDNVVFMSEYIHDQEDNVTAIFEADKAICYDSPNSEPVKIRKYEFSYLFLGYKPGSFYQLFNSVFNGGYFARIDSSELQRMENVSEEYYKYLLDLKDKHTKEKEAEYKIRDEAKLAEIEKKKKREKRN